MKNLKKKKKTASCEGYYGYYWHGCVYNGKYHTDGHCLFYPVNVKKDIHFFSKQAVAKKFGTCL